jgi:hypothetical protein
MAKWKKARKRRHKSKQPSSNQLETLPLAREHPSGPTAIGIHYLAPIPGAREGGLPYVGIASTPETVERDLRIFGLGIATGRAERKKRKERRSSPATIRRNAEICQRRKTDPKKWTFGRLAKEYGVARQTILRILKQAAKWFQAANDLSAH